MATKPGHVHSPIVISCEAKDTLLNHKRRFSCSLKITMDVIESAIIHAMARGSDDPAAIALLVRQRNTA